GERAGNVIGPALAQRLEAAPAIVALQRHAEEAAELAIEVAASALRMVDGANVDVAHRSQTVLQEAQRDALARPRVAGHHHEAAVGKGQAHAPAKGVDLR